jgi:hypothetical protein
MQGFRDGESAGVSEDAFDRIFGPFVVVDERGFASLALPGVGTAELYRHPKGEAWTGFSLGRFPWAVLDLVAEFMKQTEAVTLLPEGIALLANEGKRADLPEDLREHAVVVQTGQHMAEAIKVAKPI